MTKDPDNEEPRPIRVALEIDLENFLAAFAAMMEGKTWHYWPSGKPRRITPADARRMAIEFLAAGGLVGRPSRQRPANPESDTEAGGRHPRAFPRYNPPPLEFPPWDDHDFWKLLNKKKRAKRGLSESGLERAATRRWYAKPKARYAYAKNDASWDQANFDKKERRDKALEQLPQICGSLDIVFPDDYTQNLAWLKAKKFLESGPLEQLRWNWKDSEWRPRPGDERAGNKVSLVAIVAAAAIRTPACQRRRGIDEALTILYDDLGLPPPEVEVALAALEAFER